jgi:predicted Zn-dependent protease
VDEAIAWVDRAALLTPDHPALAAIRGEALTAVWRFREAIAPLARVAEAAPRDDTAWTALALARGSAGDDLGALDAAHRGLAIQPRDQDLLRVQALSLRALGAPEDEVLAAQRAYLAYRPADAIPRVKAKCSKAVPGCANERSPVHVHELRPAK